MAKEKLEKKARRKKKIRSYISQEGKEKKFLKIELYTTKKVLDSRRIAIPNQKTSLNWIKVQNKKFGNYTILISLSSKIQTWEEKISLKE